MTIVAIGSWVPGLRVENAPMLARFGKDQAFLDGKLGFQRRALKTAGMTTSELAVRAVEDLENQITIDRGKIGLLVVVTQNPDRKIPHTSAIVHQKLGLSKNCATFDMSQGCAGYPHAVAAIEGMLAVAGIELAIVITCDPYSDIIDTADPGTAMIFGDAATATLITRSGEGYVLRGASFGTLPGSADCLQCNEHFRMDGRQVMSNVAHEVPNCIRMLLRQHQIEPPDIPFYAFHQASLHVVELLRRNLGLEESQAPFEAENIGNTVSSSVPLLLKLRVNDRRHSRMVMSGFGVGFSWGAALIEYNKGSMPT